MKLPKTPQSGFSLIEMIVSLGVFSVVITIAVGALLTMIASNNQLQAEQSVMTNLSFALDSMTREIRTGSHYYCVAYENANTGANGEKIFQDNHNISGSSNLGNKTQDCASGNYETTGSWPKPYQGLAFIEGGQSITGAPDTRIVYYFYKDSSDPKNNKLMRRIGTASGEAQEISSSGIVIDNFEFYVTGSEPQSSGGNDQPTVTIFVEAHDASDTNPVGPKKYRLQTTITQRALDI